MGINISREVAKATVIALLSEAYDKYGYDQKVSMIKYVRDALHVQNVSHTKFGLKEAKDLVEGYLNTNDVFNTNSLNVAVTHFLYCIGNVPQPLKDSAATLGDILGDALTKANQPKPEKYLVFGDETKVYTAHSVDEARRFRDYAVDKLYHYGVKIAQEIK